MLNKVTLIGHLGKDPELRNISSGATVTRFSLATSERYKDKDGNIQTQTEWHNIVLWRDQAEMAAKYLKKGMLVYVEGKITSRSWDDKDGNKRYITEIVANSFKLLEKREHPEGGYHTPEQPTNPDSGKSQAEEPQPDPYDNDLPF
jgi:single-strand DNA-binding protein